MQTKQCAGKLFDATRPAEKSVRDNFRSGGRVGRNHWQTGCHGFQKHNSETFLGAGETEGMCRRILAREIAERDGTDPLDIAFQPKFTGQPLPVAAPRAVPDNSDEQVRRLADGAGGGMKQNIDLFPRVVAANTENHEAAGWRPSFRVAQTQAPLAEVNGLRNNPDRAAVAISAADVFRTILADCHDPVRTPDMPGFQTGLNRHAGFREARLKRDGIGEYAFDVGDMRRTGPGYGVAIKVDSDHGIHAAHVFKAE